MSGVLHASHLVVLCLICSKILSLFRQRNINSYMPHDRIMHRDSAFDISLSVFYAALLLHVYLYSMVILKKFTDTHDVIKVGRMQSQLILASIITHHQAIWVPNISIILSPFPKSIKTHYSSPSDLMWAKAENLSWGYPWIDKRKRQGFKNNCQKIGSVYTSMYEREKKIIKEASES